MSRRGLLWILLAVSIGLNLFFAGVWAGGRLADGGPPRFQRREAPFVGLPSESRRVLRDVVRQSRPDRQALHEARRQAALALAADPYDRVAADTALRTARDRQAAMRARTDAALLNAAEGLDAEQREALAGLIRRGTPDDERRALRRP